MNPIALNNSMSATGASTVAGIGASTKDDDRQEYDGYFKSFIRECRSPLGIPRFLYYPVVAQGSSNLESILARLQGSATPNYTDRAADDWMAHYPGHIQINAGISDINETNQAGRAALMGQIIETIQSPPINALAWLTYLTPADPIPGSQVTFDRLTRIQERNMAYYLVALRYNIPILNGRPAVIDQMTGGFQADLNLGGDPLHMNGDGGYAFGELMARQVNESPAAWPPGPQAPWLADANDDDSAAAYLCDNMLFLNDSNADGRPDGWGGTGTVTLEDPTADEIAGGYLGKWATVAANGSLTRTITGLTPGHRMYLAWRYKYTHAGGTAAGVQRARTLDSSAGNPQDFVDDDDDAARSKTGMQIAMPIVPAGNDRVLFTFQPGGNGTLAVAQLTLMDLTALELDAIAEAR